MFLDFEKLRVREHAYPHVFQVFFFFFFFHVSPFREATALSIQVMGLNGWLFQLA
jgi:hypothetical protein